MSATSRGRTAWSSFMNRNRGSSVDSVNIDAIFASGSSAKRHYAIEVK